MGELAAMPALTQSGFDHHFESDVVVAAWDLFRFYIRSVNHLAPFVRFGE